MFYRRNSNLLFGSNQIQEILSNEEAKQQSETQREKTHAEAKKQKNKMMIVIRRRNSNSSRISSNKKQIIQSEWYLCYMKWLQTNGSYARSFVCSSVSFSLGCWLLRVLLLYTSWCFCWCVCFFHFIPMVQHQFGSTYHVFLFSRCFIVQESAIHYSLNFWFFVELVGFESSEKWSL